MNVSQGMAILYKRQGQLAPIVLKTVEETNRRQEQLTRFFVLFVCKDSKEDLAFWEDILKKPSLNQEKVNSLQKIVANHKCIMAKNPLQGMSQEQRDQTLKCCVAHERRQMVRFFIDTMKEAKLIHCDEEASHVFCHLKAQASLDDVPQIVGPNFGRYLEAILEQRLEKPAIQATPTPRPIRPSPEWRAFSSSNQQRFKEILFFACVIGICILVLGKKYG
jgi:hypothetical protein